MRIRVRLRDFINSKYHRDRTYYFDGILLSSVHEDFKKAYGTSGQTIYPYSIKKGKAEILKFAEFDLGLDVRSECEITLEFEDFSLWIKKEPDREKAVVLCSVKKVWLPRKTKISLTHYETFMILDKYYGYYYIFPPNLILPKTKEDLWKFFEFLRFKKNLLLPPNHRGGRSVYTTFCYLEIKWIVFPPEAIPDNCIVLENIQSAVSEFVEWQDNRYRIIL